jgi:hypothetical protein
MGPSLTTPDVVRLPCIKDTNRELFFYRPGIISLILRKFFSYFSLFILLLINFLQKFIFHNLLAKKYFLFKKYEFPL